MVPRILISSFLLSLSLVQFSNGAKKRLNLTHDEYLRIREDIVEVLETEHCGPGQHTEESHCGPIFVRLAWHDAGTWSDRTMTGGPRACMRWPEGESQHEANNGLDIARDRLEPLAEKWSGKIGFADLWALAAVVSIEEMRGPVVPFRLGRIDGDVDCSVEEGRLPDGDENLDQMRDLFHGHRMNFTDRDIVALVGAHTLGECHLWNSGYEFQWNLQPYVFTNELFRDLVDDFNIWQWKDHITPPPHNKLQKVSTQQTMMLLADWELWENPATSGYVREFADDQNAFFEAFARVYQELLELGYSEGDLTWPDDLPRESVAVA